jgi:hypothetical protein
MQRSRGVDAPSSLNSNGWTLDRISHQADLLNWELFASI